LVKEVLNNIPSGYLADSGVNEKSECAAHAASGSLKQEFVIGGFTEGSRENLWALVLGAYRNAKLHYFGHSGSGFTEKSIQDALKR
jgi:ATP-dependent DNA ligase